jgi:hypothetical protein
MTNVLLQLPNILCLGLDKSFELKSLVYSQARERDQSAGRQRRSCATTMAKPTNMRNFVA